MVEKAEFSADSQEAPENHDTQMAEKYSQQTDSGGQGTSDQENQEDKSTETSEESEEDKSTESDKESEGESEETEEEGNEPSKEDFDKYRKEYADNGELSDETYQELQEKYNLPKEVVDDYVQQQQTATKAIESAGYAVVGGQENFKAMAEWAKQNLPEGEVKEFNQKVNSGDVEEAVQAVSQLKSRYTEAVGDEPSLVEGNGSTNTAVGYESRAELTRDMSDPRYKKDPAFRAQVERKLQHSKVL